MRRSHWWVVAGVASIMLLGAVQTEGLELSEQSTLERRGGKHHSKKKDKNKKEEAGPTPTPTPTPAAKGKKGKGGKSEKKPSSSSSSSTPTPTPTPSALFPTPVGGSGHIVHVSSKAAEAVCRPKTPLGGDVPQSNSVPQCGLNSTLTCCTPVAVALELETQLAFYARLSVSARCSKARSLSACEMCTTDQYLEPIRWCRPFCMAVYEACKNDRYDKDSIETLSDRWGTAQEWCNEQRFYHTSNCFDGSKAIPPKQPGRDEDAFSLPVNAAGEIEKEKKEVKRVTAKKPAQKLGEPATVMKKAPGKKK